MLAIRRFTTDEAPDALMEEIRRLLDRAFDGDFSDEDWEHTLGGWHVVVTDGEIVLAHAAVVPRFLLGRGSAWRRLVAPRPIFDGWQTTRSWSSDSA